MKIYIAVDMEGISGIYSSEYLLRDGAKYAVGQRLATEDTNAAVRGAFDGGADEVIVADMHGMSGNLLVESLDPRALLFAGTPRVPRFAFLDETVDGVFLIGYHAMAGTPYANLEHTMSSKSWHKFTVNGKAYGELGIDAEIAAESGVPVILASGDDKLCAEAEHWLPGIETACVKHGLARQAALGLSPERGHEVIYAAAKRAVEALKAGKHYTLPEVVSPATVDITYKMMEDADAAEGFNAVRVDGYTIESRFPRLSDKYGGLWSDRGIEQKIH